MHSSHEPLSNQSNGSDRPITPRGCLRDVAIVGLILEIGWSLFWWYVTRLSDNPRDLFFSWNLFTVAEIIGFSIPLLIFYGLWQKWKTSRLIVIGVIGWSTLIIGYFRWFVG